MFSWVRRMERASEVSPNANEQFVNPQTSDLGHNEEGRDVPRSIKLLSFNIQVGIQTTAYRQYVTKGWKHVLPHEARAQNLQAIAKLIGEHDVVALQEVDAGSLRSGFVNQVEFLAEVAGFPYWYAQLNRDLGLIAQHGNGVLSRMLPSGLEDHKLPGIIPGRGAMILRVPYAGDELVVVMLHLSLGERSRQRQLAYIAEMVANERQVVLMGDMNTQVSRLMQDSPLKALNLEAADADAATYPAWQPSQCLDHVLVSPTLSVRSAEVLDCQVSDHLPVAVEIAARTKPALQ